jgi:hypothetical protein
VAPVVLAVAGLLGAGCAALPLPCNITLAAVPPEVSVEAGEALPANLQVLAGPGDFDPNGTAILADTAGSATVNIQLRGDAIARVDAHTGSHTGESMAVAVNGTVVAVPLIQSALPDGSIQITSGAADDPDLAEAFASCVR